MRPGSNVGEDAGGAGVGDEERRTRMVERTARPLPAWGRIVSDGGGRKIEIPSQVKNKEKKMNKLGVREKQRMQNTRKSELKPIGVDCAPSSRGRRFIRVY